MLMWRSTDFLVVRALCLTGTIMLTFVCASPACCHRISSDGFPKDMEKIMQHVDQAVEFIGGACTVPHNWRKPNRFLVTQGMSQP